MLPQNFQKILKKMANRIPGVPLISIRSVLLRVVEGDAAVCLTSTAIDTAVKVLRKEGEGGLEEAVRAVLQEAKHESIVYRALNRVREKLTDDPISESGDPSSQLFLELLSLAVFPASIKMRLCFAILNKLAQHMQDTAQSNDDVSALRQQAKL